MTLIERLRKAGYDPKINVYALLPEAVDAIQSLQEAAFVQRGELLLALGERDALAAKLATLEADAERWNFAVDKQDWAVCQWQEDRKRWKPINNYVGIDAAIDAAKGGK
jgi:hypothetical protein